MTAPSISLPLFRAFDNAGAPLSGGLLYTYSAGTTTPKTTYSDAAGVTPNANPVVLDTSGTATVRLGSGSYKFVLKDSTGVTTYWTLDNYNAADYGATGANPSASIGLTAVNGSAATFLRSDGAPALDVTISPTWSGAHVFSSTTNPTINDGLGSQYAVGFRSMPQNTQGAGYTLVASDNGKSVTVTGGVTIPNSVFSAGNAVLIYNNSAGTITITAGITTLRLGGTATTGNRSLAQRGTASVYFVSATEAVVSGAGVT